MNFRHAKAVLAGVAALGLLTGCGLIEGEGDKTGGGSTPAGNAGDNNAQGAGNTGPTAPPQRPVAATAQPDGQNVLKATVNSFKADGAGFATLTYTLENVGEDNFSINGDGQFRTVDNRTMSVQPSNVSVRDDQAREIQSTLADSDRNCLCYWNPPGFDYYELQRGQKVTFANMFQISDQAQTVTVMLPRFKPVQGVRVERP